MEAQDQNRKQAQKRPQTPQNYAMTAVLKNSLRIYKKVAKDVENDNIVKIRDVMDALKAKYSDLEIVKNVIILTNTYKRIWTLVFHEAFDIEQLKKLDNFNSINICNMDHVVEDASIKKEEREQFIFRFMISQIRFDLNKVYNCMLTEGFKKEEIIDTCYEHHSDQEYRHMENDVIRCKVKYR